jgi:hypothetical protein
MLRLRNRGKAPVDMHRTVKDRFSDHWSRDDAAIKHDRQLPTDMCCSERSELACGIRVQPNPYNRPARLRFEDAVGVGDFIIVDNRSSRSSIALTHRVASDVSSLCDFDGVIDLDAEVANRTLGADLRTTTSSPDAQHDRASQPRSAGLPPGRSRPARLPPPPRARSPPHILSRSPRSTAAVTSSR